MKNRLTQKKATILDNRAPKNPTQTRYNRFRTGPRGRMKSSFTDAVDGFNKAMKQRKTLYEKYFGDL